MTLDFDKLQSLYDAQLTAFAEQKTLFRLARYEILHHLLGLSPEYYAGAEIGFCQGYWTLSSGSGVPNSERLYATDLRGIWDRYECYRSSLRRHPQYGVMSVLRDHSMVLVYRLDHEVPGLIPIVGQRYTGR